MPQTIHKPSKCCDVEYDINPQNSDNLYSFWWSLSLSLSPPPPFILPSFLPTSISLPLPCTSTEGDSQGFTDTYLEAIRRQREAQRSVGSDTADIFQQALPYEIYMRIFSNLSAHDVCQAMRVCKVLHYSELTYVTLYMYTCTYMYVMTESKIKETRYSITSRIQRNRIRCRYMAFIP